MDIKIKKKLSSVINHVKSHPAIYAYTAGAIVGIASTAVGIAYNRKLVDLNQALKQIHDGGHTGLFYKVDAENILLLIPAPEDFQP